MTAFPGESENAAGMLDSTKGLRGMLEAMEDERRGQRVQNTSGDTPKEGAGARMSPIRATQEGAGSSLEELLDRYDD